MAASAKKVLFTSHTANFQKFNRPFMRMLKEQGYTVHYASAGEEKILDTDKEFVVPFERSPFKLGNIKACFQLKKIIDREKYDLIHTHTPMGSVVTRLAARKARKNGTRIIYTAHGFHFFKGAPLLNWIVYYPIEKFMARHTDTLITINNEDFERAKVRFKTQVEYVPGVGIDPNKFDVKMNKNEKTMLRKSLGLKDTDFVMLYPAELNKNKNQTAIIKVMERLVAENSNIQLLLPGLDSLKGFHQKMINDKGLKNNVQLLGYRNDIPQLLKITDLSISVSRREGLPVNVMEAMYLGIPVVATDCRGNKDLIEDGAGILIRDGRLDDLYKAISRMTTEITLRTVLTRQAYSRIERYSLLKVLDLTARLYGLDIKQSPTRVLQVVTVMNRAGLETMLMNYYRNIDRSKIQFDFLVHRSEKGDYDDEIESLGGRIYQVNPISLKKVSTYNRDLRALFKAHPEYKVVHSHLDALSALPLAAAKRAGVPMRISHSHTSSFDKGYKFYVRQTLKQFIPMYATHYAACSLEALQFMFGKKVKGRVIPNAIDLEAYRFDSTTRKQVRDSLGVKNEIVIGHVGRFSYPKNHTFLVDVFLEMLKSRKDLVLVLAGTGELESEIKNKVSSNGISSQVRFLGVRADISKLMQGMDVFLMPSRYEGLPVVSIEAQATGLPCVFSDVITEDLSLTDKTHFLKLSLPLSKWAEAVLNHVDDEYDRSAVSLTGTEYDIKSEVVKLMSFYESRS